MAPSHTQQNRQLVILTGLSGSGKGSVLRTFEDLGFYCVDNLPVSFIPSFAELYMAGGGEFDRAVLLMDAREGEQLKRLPDVYRKLRREYPATLVFIEASDLALARRFNETRRPHPMGAEFSISEGIRLERKQMAAIRALSDVVIDTTKFTVHDLRQFIIERFQKAGRKPLLISLMSFGYRFGLPADADLVFDVRFLPNPHFVPKLRPFSGKNARVREVHPVVQADGAVLAAHRRAAGIPDPALHSRREKLSDHCVRMHRRPPQVRDDGRGGFQGAGEARLHDETRTSRSRASCIVTYWTTDAGAGKFASGNVERQELVHPKEKSRVKTSSETRGLFQFVRPYRLRLIFGVALLADRGNLRRIGRANDHSRRGHDLESS